MREEIVFPRVESLVGSLIPGDQPCNHIPTSNTEKNENVLFTYWGTYVYMSVHNDDKEKEKIISRNNKVMGGTGKREKRGK